MKLQEILLQRGFSLDRVKLIRHPYNQQNVKSIYDSGTIDYYTATQSRDVLKNADYVITFLGTSGTYGELISCHKIVGVQQNVIVPPPSGFPLDDGVVNYFYVLEPCNLLDDLIHRLVIDWGKATRVWNQWATMEKEIITIAPLSRSSIVDDFRSFEETELSFTDLKEIIENPLIYQDWHAVLSSVNAIYMIVYMGDGQQYIGSAYGEQGLLGRWRTYIETLDGGNIKITNLLKEEENAYLSFRFSILRILPKSLTADEVISYENQYKERFLTKRFGLNAN